MKKLSLILALAILAFGMVLAGCDPLADTSPTATPAAATATPDPAATATPTPAVATATPTATPTASPTPTPAPVHATSILVAPSSKSLVIGGTVQLGVTFTPSTTTDKSVSWASGSTSVATVNSSGLVTAVAVGTAFITATSTDGSHTSSCTITVSPTTVAATGVSLSASTMSLSVGGATGTLTATLSPNNTTESPVWSSSDDTVASVSGGVVTALKAGTTTITVTLGAFTDTCDVTVTQPVTSVSLPGTADVVVGSTISLTATVGPADASDPSVTWSSDTESVATVLDGVVTGVSAGTATITATAGGISDTCTVTVLDDATIYTSTSETINLVLNSTYNYQAVISPLSTQLKAGDIVYMTLKGSSSANLVNFYTAFVDNSSGWTAISGYTNILSNFPAGKNFETTIAIPITSTASGASAAANKIVFGEDLTGGNPSTVTLTSFKIEIKRISPVSTNSDVTYDLNYTGSSNPIVSVVTGGKAVSLAASRTAYTLEGWYNESGATTPVDFNAVISSDITFYANWTAVPTYTVSFDSNGGSTVGSQTISENDVAIRPASAPTKAAVGVTTLDFESTTCYTFVDWYSDSGLTTLYDFATPVTMNTTIYAKWNDAAAIYSRIAPSWCSTTQASATVANPVATGNSSSYAWQVTQGAGYNAGAATLITLPAGKVLSDYTSVSFKLNRKSGTGTDNGWKTWNLGIYNSTITPGGTALSAIGTGTTLSSAADDAWTTITVTLGSGKSSVTTNSVYVTIYNGGAATIFYVDDITFIP